MRAVDLKFVFVLALSLAGAVHAAPLPDSTYTALRSARPDGRRVPVQGLILERDIFQFRPGEGGKYRISGSITQEGVSKGFRALVSLVSLARDQPA